MSYTYATPLNVTNKSASGSVPAAGLKNGMTIKVHIDSSDSRSSYIRSATVANLRKSKSGNYVHFDIAELNTDESLELTAGEWIKVI